MAAQPGAGVTLFPSLLSTLCFHPPCFIGGVSKSPADTTACLVSRFARDDGASGRQSKISPIPPGLPENSTEARFAAQHTRGCVRVSLLSTRLRSSGGRVQRERPARLARSGEMGPRRVACVTPTWEVGGGAHPGRCSCGAHWPPAQKWANAAPPSVPSCLFSVCKSLNRTKRLCEACPAKGMPPFTRCRHCRLPLTAPPAPHESPWVRATTPLACVWKVLNSCKLGILVLDE